MGDRGFVFIINNIEFDHLKNRSGSDEDVDCLYNFFAKTIYWHDAFNVKRNLTVSAMKEQFSHLSNRDFSTYNAFFVFILSHGNRYGICGTDSKPHDYENVLNVERDVLPLFSNSKCPTLCEKPKVFIMQACRGDQDDEGYSVETDAVMNSPPVNYTRHIPNFSEYLLCYPCIKGYTSLRNTGNGTYFINSMMKIFTEKYRKEDIIRMLIRVNYNVARQHNGLHIKQMPSHDNRLTRLTYFDGYFIEMKKQLEKRGVTF